MIEWTKETKLLLISISCNKRIYIVIPAVFPPGDCPNPGIEPRSPTLQVDSLPSGPSEKTKNTGVGSLSLLQPIPSQPRNQIGVSCIVGRFFTSCANSGKEHASNTGDMVLIPGWRRSPGKGNGNPLQYSSLENPTERRTLGGYS